MRAIDHKRRLVAAIWTAVCMIALVLLAAPAQAHPGHAHESPLVAASAAPMPISAAAEALVKEATDSRSEEMATIGAVEKSAFEPQPAETSAVVLFEHAGGRPVPKDSCVGACCGAGACCTTGLPVEPVIGVAPRLSAQRFRQPAIPALSGIKPGRLSEPPRSFA